MKRRKINPASNIFDVYAAPLFLLGVGLTLLTLASTISFPKPIELAETRGYLDSYYFRQTGRGKDDYATVISLQGGNRFWTDVINKDNAESILKERGVEIRYYIDTHSKHIPIDGNAVKAYGLWVNGSQIQSTDETIGHDKVVVHYYFPAIGVFLIVLAVLIHRRNKAKYLRHT